MANYYAEVCDDCPAGYFCLDGAIEPTICAAGHYCLAKTATQDGTDCEIGNYQPETGRTSCLKCPPGYFCDQPGQAYLDFS